MIRSVAATPLENLRIGDIVISARQTMGKIVYIQPYGENNYERDYKGRTLKVEWELGGYSLFSHQQFTHVAYVGR